MKKVISLVLVISLFSLLVQVYAESNSVVSYSRAKTTMLSNSRTLKKLEAQERKMFMQYSSTVQNTKDMRTDGISFEMYGRKFFYKFDDQRQMQLTLMKELYPLQLKYYWEMSNKSKLVTEKALSLGLRDLYLGFMKSDRDLGVAKRKFELAKKKYDVNQLKFEQGLISRLDFEEAEYDLLKAEKSVEEVKRNRENMTRSLNSFICTPVSTEYDTVINNELSRSINLNTVDYYIDKALSERLEIKNIEEEISLKELNLEILTKHKLNEINVEVKKQYEDVKLDIESLKIKLEKTKYDIENEIKKAYIEIKNEINNVQNMAETIKMQTRSLEKLRSQYDQGLIPKLILDEFEIGIDELKVGYDLVIYSYNTKVMKLEEAAGLGPAYYKG